MPPVFDTGGSKSFCLVKNVLPIFKAPLRYPASHGVVVKKKILNL